jgi:hypothetical protein
MPRIKLTFVLEFLDQPTESIYPVTGRSGNCYGYASICPKRGTYCLRLDEETYRAARADLFAVGRRFYYPIPDVEVEIIEDQPAPPSPPASDDAPISHTAAATEADLASMDALAQSLPIPTISKPARRRARATA